MMPAQPPKPEFSRVVEVPKRRGKTVTLAIAAAPAERAALARRFDLLALDRLEAGLQLELQRDGIVQVSGTLVAELEQSCVVTLEPVPSRLAEEFTLLYGPPEADSEIELDGEAEPVEPFEGDRIDVGEAVAQQLSLALDPFPRAPGATIDA